jgi:CCR4-NOT transcription complex subunit 7/8
VVVKPVGEFKTAGAYQYTTIRTNVDMLKMIQLGLTFCNEKGELPKHNGELCVWQFNFREFNPENDMYAPESIRLLLDSGINFKANVEKGVDQVHFAELLMTSGVVLNSDVSWITFHAGYDFGCAPYKSERCFL